MLTCSKHTHSHAQPYITNSEQLSSLESLQHFSSVSSNPPSQTASTDPHSHHPTPITHQLAEKEIGPTLLFCGSLCNQAISCTRPGAVEIRRGWSSPKKQQEAAGHLSPLLRDSTEKLQGGAARRGVYMEAVWKMCVNCVCMHQGVVE